MTETTNVYFHNNDWQILSEYDGSNNHKKSYFYGNYIDEVLMSFVLPINSSCKYYVHDHLYSPGALLYYSGQAVERYEYDAYGNCQIMDASYNPRSSSSYGNPYYFTGRQLDDLDGGNLKIQYNRNRYYDYYTGRWLTHDPLGITPNPQWPNEMRPKVQYSGTSNLYEYVKSSPESNGDPFGLLSPVFGPGIGLPDMHGGMLGRICRAAGRSCCDKCVPLSKRFKVNKVHIVPKGSTPGEVRTIRRISLLLSIASSVRFTEPYFDPTCPVGYVISDMYVNVMVAAAGRSLGWHMYLEIQEDDCMKERCGTALWLKRRYNWKKGKKYNHQCRVGSFVAEMDMYGDYEEAKNSIDECIEDFESLFEYNMERGIDTCPD